MVRSSPRGHDRQLYRFGKRAFDVLLAGMGVLLSAPLWIVVSIAIMLEDGRPIFFTQERVGRDGRRFRLRKFRTMRATANEVVDLPPRLDPRVTTVGRLLRVTALDELPTLLHIFQGELSFVGPKPLPPVVQDPSDPDHGRALEELPRFSDRSAVPPGLTGLAQICARKNASYRTKFRYDKLYVRKASLMLDFWLVTASFMRTFRGRWEDTRVAAPPEAGHPVEVGH